MSYSTNTRKFTNMVYEMMDEGVIDPRAIAEMCLSYMSESEVEDMVRSNDLYEDIEDEDSETN